VLMFSCHLFGQWSGANAITQYCGFEPIFHPLQVLT
jgi:hypothetical protein